jgi:uncharacterized protein YndB with AHSA1/START domain
MNTGTLLTDGAQPAVRLERHLSDPPGIVWRALTEREQLRSWFPCDVVLAGGKWEVGASISFPFPAEVIDLTLTGEVLEVQEPARLAFTWGNETLRFELTPVDDGTLLALIDELPAAIAARNGAGWETCLDRLAGLEPDAGAWRGHFDAYVAAFAPTLGPQEGPPAGYKGDVVEES